MNSRLNPFIAALRPHRRLVGGCLLGVALLALVWVAQIVSEWERGRRQAASSAKQRKARTKVVEVRKDADARALEATVNRNLASLTDGANVRVVWIEDPGKKSADPFANSDSLRLAGWDARGGGYRRLVNEPGNYGRPLLTPGGDAVIYTDKHVKRQDGKKHLTPEIHLVDWQGDTDRVLGPGFAVDARLDPATGRTWVYALETIIPSKHISMSGTTLIRFPLDEPARREVVWTRTPLSVDNLQISRDGKRFAGLFPWPDAGVADVATGQWHKLDLGCWPSMSPDNSYVSWVFDGRHRALRLYAPEGGTRWTVDLSNAPDMKGREAYHPRWGNHPRYAVFTGPYASKKRSKNSIAAGGLTAEVYVGKFSESLKGMESFVRLTHNTGGDFYPDVWIASGETTALTSFTQSPAVPVKPAETWPPEPAQLQFVWQDLKAENEIPGVPGRLPCHLEARGLARHTPFLGALLDGGWFEADEASEAALATAVRTQKAFTVQALITEWPGGPPAAVRPLVSWRTAEGDPYFQLSRHGGKLVAEFGRGPGRTVRPLDRPITPGQPYALAIAMTEGLWHWTIDGRPLVEGAESPAGFLAKWPDGRLVVGDSSGVADGRRASIERLTIHSRGLEPPSLAQRATLDLAAAKNRSWPAPIRLRARLVEATEPDLEKLDTYHRMLIDHTYEVVDVMEGRYDHPKIVVLHWAVLDDRPVPGLPRDEGRVYELTLEPFAAHSELDGELTDVTSSEFGLPLYLDVTTPPVPTT